ncbi:hypothetical protein ACIGNX_11250 [Actinosynnema sp. NPDC053489]|uniref:hypothetical protein n=1 Tax=Actinosynnema sp. NPDC053489 TaxID=3363916 RepID=UPI0037CB4B2F
MPESRTPAAVLAPAVALPLVTSHAAGAAVLVAELPGLPDCPTHRAATDLGAGRPSGLNPAWSSAARTRRRCAGTAPA